MRTDLIKVSTLEMAKEDWLRFRLHGIGASEIATIMGLNKYKSSHQLFYEKVEQNIEEFENVSMFMGKYMEDSIAELWQYYENETGSAEDAQLKMIDNFNNKKIVRKCRKINSYLVNPEYPWLFASLDRLINKGDNGKEGALELKTISGYASDIWIGGIPPQYLVQLQQQLLISDLDYGELCILKDGRYIEVFKFERTQEIIDNIIEVSKNFWDNVLQARSLLAQGLPFEHLEPAAETDNVTAYEAFMNEKYLAKAAKAEPTQEVLDHATDYTQCNNEINDIDKKKKYYAMLIKDHMREAELIDFGSQGKITWKVDKNGKRTLRIAIEVKEKAVAA